MSFARLLVVVFIVSTVSTLIGLYVGNMIGEQSGYAICVSEEDDDAVRVRRF